MQNKFKNLAASTQDVALLSEQVLGLTPVTNETLSLVSGGRVGGFSTQIVWDPEGSVPE
jgi:hypothetical protein